MIKIENKYAILLEEKQSKNIFLKKERGKTTDISESFIFDTKENAMRKIKEISRYDRYNMFTKKRVIKIKIETNFSSEYEVLNNGQNN